MDFKKGHWYQIKDVSGFIDRAAGVSATNRKIVHAIQSRVFIATGLTEYGDVCKITEITGEPIVKPRTADGGELVNWFISSEYKFVTDCTPEHVLNPVIFPVAVPLNFSEPPAFMYAGIWNAHTKYNKDDCVTHNNQNYVCAALRVGGIEPGTNSSVWKLVTTSVEEYKIEIPGVKEYKFASAQQLCYAAQVALEMHRVDQKLRGVDEPIVIIVTHGKRKFRVTGINEVDKLKRWSESCRKAEDEDRVVQQFEIKD